MLDCIALMIRFSNTARITIFRCSAIISIFISKSNIREKFRVNSGGPTSSRWDGLPVKYVIAVIKFQVGTSKHFSLKSLYENIVEY